MCSTISMVTVFRIDAGIFGDVLLVLSAGHQDCA